MEIFAYRKFLHIFHYLFKYIIYYILYIHTNHSINLLKISYLDATGESLFNKEYNLLQPGILQKYLRIELGTWVEKKKCTAFSCAFLFLGLPISL